MTVIDVYSLRNAKMVLERVGENLVSEAIKEVAYQEYYFGGSARGNSSSSVYTPERDFLPISCREVITKLSQLARNLPRDIDLLSFDCTINQLKVSITKRVDLPFFPRTLTNFQPKVVAFVGGGLQRVHSN